MIQHFPSTVLQVCGLQLLRSLLFAANYIPTHLCCFGDPATPVIIILTVLSCPPLPIFSVSNMLIHQT